MQAKLSGVLALAGDFQQAEAVALSVGRAEDRSAAAMSLAWALAEAGETARAEFMATQAESSARAAADPDDEHESVTRALIRCGDYGRAERVARLIASPRKQVEKLAEVGVALAKAGQAEKAGSLITDCEALTHSIDPASWEREAALADVATALAQVGDVRRAESLAGSITDHTWKSRALCELTTALALSGDYQRASTIVTSVRATFWHGHAMMDLVSALVKAGQYDRAHANATSVSEPEYKACALARLAAGLAEAGRRDQAERFAAEAESLARSTVNPYFNGDSQLSYNQTSALTNVARELAKGRFHERAENVIRAMTHPRQTAIALTELAGVFARAGDRARADSAATRAETIARSLPADDRARTLCEVVRALVLNRDYQHAEALARSICEPSWGQAAALEAAAVALAELGEFEQADAIARSISDTDQLYRARSFGALAEALLGTGRPDAARRYVTYQCQEARWIEALPVLLALEPDAARVLA